MCDGNGDVPEQRDEEEKKESDSARFSFPCIICYEEQHAISRVEIFAGNYVEIVSEKIAKIFREIPVSSF